jgi:hypothetical protein
VKRIALVALIIALLAAGCGDDKKNASTTDTSAVTPEEAVKQAEAATGTSLTTVPLPSGGGTTTTTAKSGGQAGATTTTPTTDPSVTMKLDRQCVRRGPTGDMQGLTVTTSPGDTVAWSTEYSDHSNEMSKPEYKTGSGYGKADDKGNFHTEWIVPIQAPPGEATLHTIAKGKLQPPLKFRVVAENESC